MAQIIGPPENAIRCRPITAELREILDAAADANEIDRVLIVSGGQTSSRAPHLKGVPCGWTGSRRHDNGRAADIELVKDGTTLSFTDTNGSQVEAFVTDCAARGATGIGAGIHYMGRKRIHVGFGRSPADTQKLVWGAAGASANAPAWLRVAANQGWNNPVAVNAAIFAAVGSVQTTSRSVIMARGGLWLRKGPGLDFDRAKLLNEGTIVSVLGFDGEWARVDLEGDGRIDGHVFAAFLETVDMSDGGDADDGLEETVDEEAVAELLRAETADGPARRPARGSRASATS